MGVFRVRVIFMAKQASFSLKAIDLMRSSCVKIAYAVLRETDALITQMCGEYGIPYGTEEELCGLYDEGKISADWLFSFYWKLAKPKTLGIAGKGSINFHPGPLPEARGYGYHMSILEDWGYYGVTAHYMDEKFDTGNIIECRRFDVPADVLSSDLVKMTHENLFVLFSDVLSRIMRGEELPSQAQREGRYVSFMQMEKAKNILPEDDEESISRKIRAFWNPPYPGAQITIGRKKYTVIDDLVLRWIAERA